jgi:hypothetical protein
MKKSMQIILILLGALAALLLLGWLGLKVKPAPFAAYPQPSPALEMLPLPEGLPAPLERFYRQVYGERVPLITSAVVTGRATIRRGGLTLQARFRFTHAAGRDYRHYIEATFYGLPLMKVNESYVDGVSRFELPGSVTGGQPQDNQAANLGLWAESVWLPSIFLTDPRVRWEPVDEVTALLVVPFEDAEERFVVRFDSETGLMTTLESMRYKDAASPTKTLWINQALAWSKINGNTLPTVGAVTWFGDGLPWAVFTVEEVVYNADVQDYLRVKGP